MITSFKTKEGKKKKREELKRVRVSARTAKAQRKLMTAKQRELSKFKRAFDLYDIEGSGRVGPKEFRFIAKEAGFAIGKLECAGAMDRTGTITLERMVQWATMPANRLAQRKVPRSVAVHVGCHDISGGFQQQSDDIGVAICSGHVQWCVGTLI